MKPRVLRVDYDMQVPGLSSQPRMCSTSDRLLGMLACTALHDAVKDAWMHTLQCSNAIPSACRDRAQYCIGFSRLHPLHRCCAGGQTIAVCTVAGLVARLCVQAPAHLQVTTTMSA